MSTAGDDARRSLADVDEVRSDVAGRLRAPRWVRYALAAVLLLLALTQLLPTAPATVAALLLAVGGGALAGTVRERSGINPQVADARGHRLVLGLVGFVVVAYSAAAVLTLTLGWSWAWVAAGLLAAAAVLLTSRWAEQVAARG